MNKKTILVTGANGQLGNTLEQLWASSQLQQQYELVLLNRASLDISQASDVDATLSQSNPSIIINAAAYTQVDQAESDADKAFAVNEQGARNLASWVRANKAGMIHVSTDFVFGGAGGSSTTATPSPYLPEDKPAPSGVYGASKLAGERAVQELLPDAGLIIRTSWLYSEHGSNFVKTMLRLMGQRDSLGVVDDQIGSPTSTHSLAQLIFVIIRRISPGLENESKLPGGVVHWSDGGAISWFEFAQAIQEQAIAKGLLLKEIPITAITTADYPTPARRPVYSVLDLSKTQKEFDCPRLSWQQQLDKVLEEIR